MKLINLKISHQITLIYTKCLHQVDRAFSLHDKDGDGKLNKTEMANMIARGKRAKAEKEAATAGGQSGKQRSALNTKRSNHLGSAKKS